MPLPLLESRLTANHFVGLSSSHVTTPREPRQIAPTATCYVEHEYGQCLGSLPVRFGESVCVTSIDDESLRPRSLFPRRSHVMYTHQGCVAVFFVSRMVYPNSAVSSPTRYPILVARSKGHPVRVIAPPDHRRAKDWPMAPAQRWN